MKNVQKGFTLLELMIAVAILGILTLITYPSYKTYIRRVRLSGSQIHPADERADHGTLLPPKRDV